jgi:hypothetical protein
VSEAEQLLLVLADGMTAEERLILCGFPGDPYTAGPTAWRPRPWTPGRDIPMNEKWNGYTTVATFVRAGDGSFRRRTETFAAGRALMVDDVGTKVPRSVVEHAPPTAIVETSPGNEQWWYVLTEPERDMARFDAVIRAFISGKLLGADPGMSGVTRVGRLPGFVNGKKANNGFVTRLLKLDAFETYTVPQLLETFGLQLNGRRVQREKLVAEEAIERNRAFAVAYKWLARNGHLKRPEPDPSGWTEIRCPWVAEHSGGADTGAAVREPASENEFYGAFRCHHGHCADRGWADLTDYINDEAIEALDNAAAADNGEFDYE